MTLMDEEKLQLQEYNDKKNKRNFDLDLPSADHQPWNKGSFPSSNNNGSTSSTFPHLNNNISTPSLKSSATGALLSKNFNLHHHHGSIESLPNSAIVSYLQGLKGNDSSSTFTSSSSTSTSSSNNVTPNSLSTSNGIHKKDFTTIDITNGNNNLMYLPKPSSNNNNNTIIDHLPHHHHHSMLDHNIDEDDTMDGADEYEDELSIPESTTLSSSSGHQFNPLKLSHGFSQPSPHNLLIGGCSSSTNNSASTTSTATNLLLQSNEKPMCPNCQVVATRRHDKRRWWCKQCSKSFTPFRKGKKLDLIQGNNAPQCGRCCTQATRKHDKRRWWCKSCKKPFTPNQFNLNGDNNSNIYIVPNGGGGGGSGSGSGSDNETCESIYDEEKSKLELLLNHHPSSSSSILTDSPILTSTDLLFDRKRKYGSNGFDSSSELEMYNNSNGGGSKKSSSNSAFNNIIMIAQQTPNNPNSSSLSSSPIPQSPIQPLVPSPLHNSITPPGLQALSTSCSISPRSHVGGSCTTPPLLKLTNSYDIIDNDYIKDGASLLRPLQQSSSPPTSSIMNLSGDNQINKSNCKIYPEVIVGNPSSPLGRSELSPSETILENTLFSLIQINGEDKMPQVIHSWLDKSQYKHLFDDRLLKKILN